MDLATLLVFMLGLGCLIAGGEMLVRGASRLAATLGVSLPISGLTIVAVGTSLPEVVTSIIAALRGELRWRDTPCAAEIRSRNRRAGWQGLGQKT